MFNQQLHRMSIVDKVARIIIQTQIQRIRSKKYPFFERPTEQYWVSYLSELREKQE